MSEPGNSLLDVWARRVREWLAIFTAVISLLIGILSLLGNTELARKVIDTTESVKKATDKAMDDYSDQSSGRIDNELEIEDLREEIRRLKEKR